MVSAKAAKRRKTADPAVDENIQKKKQAEGERNRKGEATGRQDGPSASSAEAKPGKASKAARKGSEVDELFSQLKKAKANGKAEQQQGGAMPQKQKQKKKAAVAGSKDDIFGQGVGKKRRVDADGLAVYTEDELKVGQGGNTPQCPFDCECCF